MAKKPTSEWGRRADAAGLSQQTLARLAGVAPNSVSRGLRGEFASGVPGYLRSIIIAWEMMTEFQRLAWDTAVALDKAAEYRSEVS
jgi:hypothetical protein